MAMALALRAACRSQASPMFRHAYRLGSTSAVPLQLSKNIIVQQNAFLTSNNKTASTLVSQMVRSLSVSAPKLSSEAAGAPGHHSTLWSVERALSAALLLSLPAAIAFPSQPLDYIVAVSIVMHAHWGLEAIVVDYVRPILFGNVVPKLAHGLLILFSAATLGGLCYFIYNDIGIGKAVRKLWAVKAA